MTTRVYVMPIGVMSGTYRGPKYLKWRFSPSGLDVPWSMKDYGLVNTCLIAADVTQAQHEQLVAEIDVVAAPIDIDGNITEMAIPTIQAGMEALRIPAGWITPVHTYRELLRMIGGLFMFAQRHHGLHNEQLIDSIEQLDLRWNQIPTARRKRILATADDMGYNYSEVQPIWLVRRILKHLGDQWSDIPIIFGNLLTL